MEHPPGFEIILYYFLTSIDVTALRLNSITIKKKGDRIVEISTGLSFCRLGEESMSATACGSATGGFPTLSLTNRVFIGSGTMDPFFEHGKIRRINC
jgi:hypothetical protein